MYTAIKTFSSFDTLLQFASQGQNNLIKLITNSDLPQQFLHFVFSTQRDNQSLEKAKYMMEVVIQVC